ncbi:RapZ C-terminal domain-containing protein [Marinactinospora thermotolerans]|uniref:RapZ C-terminal domain-containing protein n=1 Tax=Marinactinospora thermotolerans TaxID=531310 RepID=UPI003D8F7F2C
MSMLIRVTSFGHGHPAGTPEGLDLVVDLRPYRDPHVSPRMRYMTARDPEVVATVQSTPGMRAALAAALSSVVALADRRDAPPVIEVGVGCTGGRHRAPAGADMLARMARALGYETEVVHRDITLPVLSR